MPLTGTRPVPLPDEVTGTGWWKTSHFRGCASQRPVYRHLMRSQKIGVVMAEQPDPSRILQIGSGFWPAKVLLSAVELELFTRLAKGAATGAGLAEDLGLAPRAVPDFPDAL